MAVEDLDWAAEVAGFGGDVQGYAVQDVLGELGRVRASRLDSGHGYFTFVAATIVAIARVR